ncbi:MAG: NAD(P)-binding domain-containing protein, partial [Acidimicrobiia bacterium]|nr:NAD(P)-binding domain-containing protein [Acidimicrobiia bacterium]
MSRRVLVTDKISESGMAALRDDPRFEVMIEDDSTSPRFEDGLAEAEALVVRSATTVGGEMMDRAPRLKVIGRAGVGVDNIDIRAASDRGIAVVNAPSGNTIAAAELTMALILSTVRHVAAADASIRAGNWDRAAFTGVELKGRRLGLIGAGRIGAEVAIRCTAFGMDVIIYDPYLSEDRAREIGSRLTNLDEVIETSDVISLHVPLTDETRNLLDAATFDRMKPGTFVVNVSRGGVVNEAALAAALASGHLGGAGLDVYEDEPLSENSPLRTAPHLTLTPHIGASTVEAQDHVAVEVAQTVTRILADGDTS